MHFHFILSEFSLGLFPRSVYSQLQKNFLLRHAASSHVLSPPCRTSLFCHRGISLSPPSNTNFLCLTFVYLLTRRPLQLLAPPPPQFLTPLWLCRSFIFQHRSTITDHPTPAHSASKHRHRSPYTCPKYFLILLSFCLPYPYVT